MLLFDHRMIEGAPLRYCHPYSAFGQLEPMEEETMPSSPNSTQSDSDNSLSSVEVTPTHIRPRPAVPSKGEARCCWKGCGTAFDSLDQLANHVARAHAASGPGGLYYCGWEGCSRDSRGFNARYKMLVHVRTHTNEKPHQCCQCDKSFSRAENLKIHSRSHSGEKPYVCPVTGCNKAYSNSSDRFKHTRTHQVEKPYQCKVPGCPKRYTDPSSLRKHVKTYKHISNEGKKGESRTPPPAPGAAGCPCPRGCCGGAPGLLRLGPTAFLDRSVSPKWNELLDPYKGDHFAQFHQTTMDIDVPLDLSVHRRAV